jgi:mannitol/fructose-specific phosphotransferase system IIA component (Ntr-type)
MFDEDDPLSFRVVDLPPSAATSSENAIKFLVGNLAEAGQSPVERVDRIACQILHRESLGSTAIGRGTALPHSKCDDVEKVQGIVGRSAIPINWPGSLDAAPVLYIYLVVTPASDPAASLRALEAVSRKIRCV